MACRALERLQISIERRPESKIGDAYVFETSDRALAFGPRYPHLCARSSRPFERCRICTQDDRTDAEDRNQLLAVAAFKQVALSQHAWPRAEVEG
jgi:hypothetical protein